MGMTVDGSYEWFPQPEQRELSVYSQFSSDQFTGQEISLEHVQIQTPYNHVSEKINLEPVYVIKETNELVYNSRMMEKGKKYPVVWGGERFMLIKEDDGVTIYRFEENGN